MNIPKRIFIVPYRNREAHKNILIEKITEYLQDENDWEMYFSHQCTNDLSIAVQPKILDS